MHVIAKKVLRDFWQVWPDAHEPLEARYRLAERSAWNCFADVRAVYPHADLVGKYTVFNIGGNKYRLVAVIHFNRARVYVRGVFTHQQYSRGRWKEEK